MTPQDLAAVLVSNHHDTADKQDVVSALTETTAPGLTISEVWRQVFVEAARLLGSTNPDSDAAEAIGRHRYEEITVVGSTVIVAELAATVDQHR